MISAVSSGGATAIRSGLARGDRAFPLLGPQNVAGSPVAGEQVCAVFAGQQDVERIHARDDAQQVVVAKRENGVNQIVPLTLLAQRNLQSVGEERRRDPRR